MDNSKPIRLSKLAREFNVGLSTIVDFLHKKGVEIENNPNSKIPGEYYSILLAEFSDSQQVKEQSLELTQRIKQRKETVNSDVKSDKSGKQEEQSEKELLIVDSATAGKTQEVSPQVTTVKSEAPAVKKEEVPKEEPKTVAKETKSVEKKEEKETEKKAGKKDDSIKVIGKLDLDSINQKTRPKKKTKAEIAAEKKAKEEASKHIAEQKKAIELEEPPKKEEEVEIEKPAEPDAPAKPVEDFIETEVEKLSGPSVVGKINIDDYLKKEEDIKKKREQDKIDRKKERQIEKEKAKTKRKRIRKDNVRVNVDKPKPTVDRTRKKRKKVEPKADVSDDLVQKQIKETYARLTAGKQKSKTAKYRREKRDQVSTRMQAEVEKQAAEKNTIQVTEFVSVNELASLMDVAVNEVIATCMNLGLFVSINQRLDAETMALVADEFGFKVEFVSAELLDELEPEEVEVNLMSRAPIVTVMGHVDHGKTKLLDQIRKANVIAGEAGGITQHIGAYSVELENGKRICFLDTPGHEAFTAMRARGAQVTDVAIIVVAADDDVMPQTVEAINHASAAGVPIVFAINKIDKPTANVDKIKEKLANMNYMVEDWGGKYQSQEISAKEGLYIEELLEKVLLEAELLDLKANPDKFATGTVIESMLDKGRGYVATLLVQSGTLKMGDVILAGTHTGHVKAMYNERGTRVDEALPATPVQVLGLGGAPQAGDKFNVMESDHEARIIANKRMQLQREVGLRTQKYITLDEIGRRLALGNFHEVNVIVKGDVDGSVEALSDSLEKLSNDEVRVAIKHKAVGQISESDVMLAAVSDAIIIGFQVRPSVSARKLAEKEQIDIRLYSIIYDAINELKDALEGLLSPVIKEKIHGSAVVLQAFNIHKVGTVAGCKMTEGKIYRESKVRVIRDGIVIFTGKLGSLKRYQDDAKEAVSGQECGLNVQSFNDIKVDDVIEAFEEFEIRKKL
jgi:translation initiation factor IF-2